MWVVKEIVNKTGIVTLTREKAFNALTTSMCRDLNEILSEWDKSPDIDKVLLTGRGRAFCAGGDVKYIREMTLSRSYESAAEFFRTEYTLNNLTGTMSTPLVPLIDGIVMGGGVGISVHAPLRVVTEKALFAMPETTIGLYPDVGGTYFLPRLTAGLGAYLGLTGQRLKGMDIKRAGVATHCVPSQNMPSLVDELTKCDPEDINRTISHFEESDPPPSSLLTADHLAQIRDIFTLPTVEDIMAALERSATPFCSEALSTLRRMCPTSLKVCLRQIQLGSTLPTLADCLHVEFALSNTTTRRDDFVEGVDAVLVKKTNSPIWSPSSLEDVHDEDIEALYTLPEGIEDIYLAKD